MQRNDGIVISGGSIHANNLAVGKNARASAESVKQEMATGDVQEAHRRYRVFISYSWFNSAERRAVVAELEKVRRVEVLVDTHALLPGDAIHAGLESMIDTADCVVVFFTERGLASGEVMKEVGLSHQKGKLIIPIVAKDVPLDTLPVYLRDLNVIVYDERLFDRAVDEIVRAVLGQANRCPDLGSSSSRAT
jgi:hypothetical protein